MSLHKFIDNLGITVGGTLINNRYFSAGVDSKRVKDLLTEVELDLPKIKEEGYYPFNVKHEGVSYEAAFRIEQWKGGQYPTIIYHHGAAEGSYDFSFNRILAKNKNDIGANLIAIQALFNHNNKEFLESIAYLSNYTLMLAASVLTVEHLIRQVKMISDNRVIVTGLSLGGFVTNLHFAYYNTADIYKPILAGARLGEVFLDSAYAKMTADKAKADPEKLRTILNFEDDIRNLDQKNIFPLLAEYDQLVKYDTNSVDFNSEQISQMPYGHSTGATKFSLLRKHILKGLNN